jgi:NAD(P) transhydrogenase
MTDYDLIVIGSGPAGEKGAAQAAYFGRRVALVEKQPLLGGAAANTGTLPSKTLRETALYLSGFRQRGLYGVEFALKREATVRDFLHREKLVTAKERERVAENLRRHGVTVFHGVASFVDATTCAVRGLDGSEQHLTASVFLIATGSSPYHPPELPFDDSRVYDSDTVLELTEIPASLAVIGAGVIGCEYACLFAALGVKVTLVDGKDTLLPFLDGELSSALRASMVGLGIDLAMPDSVASVKAGEGDFILNLRSGREVRVHTVLAASGRTGNSAGLNLEALGIGVGRRGVVEVNDRYQTAVPHIYAAGDVIGFPALASTSMEQARLAMVHAFDLRYKTSLAPVLPYGIYTIPEVSMAGATEETLMADGVDYVVGRATYAGNARGQIIGEGSGLLKLLFAREDMRLLGVHVIGEQASELVHTGLTALLTDATADLFIQTCFNYPSLSEAYKYATYDALGRR